MADQVQITLGANVSNALAGLSKFAFSAQAAAAAFIAGFATATKHAIDFADEMGKMAQKAGDTVDDFSRLAYAGKLAGVEMEGLKTGFKGLSQAIRENGRIFDDIGIGRFSNGGFRDASEVLGDIAEKFQAMPDGVRKTTLAVQLFGRSGQDLIPMLNQGREGIAKLKQEAEELGVVVSKDLAAKSEAFNDNLTKISSGVKGLFLKVADEALPVLIKATNAAVSALKVMNDELKTYFKEVDDLFKAFNGSSQLAGFSGMDKKIEAKPQDSGIEYLNREQFLRAQITRNDLFMKQNSEAYGISDLEKQKRELDYLELKLHYTEQLQTELQKSPPKGSFFGEDDPNGISKEAQEYNEKLIPVMKEQTDLLEKIKKLKAESSVSGQFAKQLLDLKNELGTTSQNLASVFVSPFQGAFTGLQGSIAGLIKGTMTWKDALRNIGSTVLNSIIDSFARMAASWITTQILMATVGKSIQAASVAATAPLAAAASAIWAVPASLATIATYGSAAAAAPGFIATSNAATLATSIAGFFDGGYTGDGDSRSPAGIVHKGEYVISNNTLNRMGPAYFDALQQGKTPMAPGGGGPTNVHIGMVGNGSHMAQQWAESREGRKYLVDFVNGQIREARG